MVSKNSWTLTRACSDRIELSSVNTGIVLFIASLKERKTSVEGINLVVVRICRRSATAIDMTDRRITL
jgi:hypothetical protein